MDVENQKAQGGTTKKKPVQSQSGYLNDPCLEWATTISWLRSITKLKIFVKGILTREDAEEALAAGVDGIIVSNHGGRQLDGVVTTAQALPEITSVVRGRVPVHVDGGIRKGSDIFKVGGGSTWTKVLQIVNFLLALTLFSQALALGADFVWVSRPALWGLAVSFTLLSTWLSRDWSSPELTCRLVQRKGGRGAGHGYPHDRVQAHHGSGGLREGVGHHPDLPYQGSRVDHQLQALNSTHRLHRFIVVIHIHPSVAL
ncbi:hypothetical protein VTK73DRAFT_5412 [Phialemonium thermophilum]|uniref:FMN hydroxy acid dehydrogenase domain-containing protein n=1 Tax=Phialemonium thermophilum TaxID=223376 RepID=A0ABR3V2T1_9PEZI